MASTTSTKTNFPDGVPISFPVYLTDPATGSPFSSTNALTVSATVTANVASNGATGSAVPTEADFIGASDGANLQGLLVESSSHPNLRAGIYNGANELAVDSSGRLTLIPDQTVNIDKYGGQSPTLDNTTIPAFSMRGKGTVAGDTSFLLETLTALAGAGVTEDIFRFAVLRAKAYTVSTGKQTASAAGNFPTQLLCSSISKNVLIVSIIVGGTTTGFTAQLNSITADSGWTGNTAITSNILNLSLGGTASGVSSVVYNTTTQTLGSAATTLATYTSGANGTVELLQGGAAILLPSGAANGIVIWNTPTAASTFHATIKWLEF